MIYLDSTNLADHNGAINLLIKTMLVCPPLTLIVANFMANDGRSRRRFNIDFIKIAIEQHLPASELTCWDQIVDRYEYSSTGRIDMVSYLLWKGYN